MQKKSKLTVFTFMMLIILALTFQPAISTYAAYPEDLISYWKLNETAGPDYEDSFGDNNGAGGSVTGADDPTPIPDEDSQVKGAQEFDDTGAGKDTQINVPVDDSFNWAADASFSIEFWIKRDGDVTGENQVAIGRYDPVSPLIWWVGIGEENDPDVTQNAANFYLQDNNSNVGIVKGINPITDNMWHHVVAVRAFIADTSDQIILYVDGELEAGPENPQFDAGFASSTAEINIGYFDIAPFYHLEGGIDEVALYDRALTLKEIKQHYDSGILGRGIDTQAAEIIGTWDQGIWYWDTDASPPPWTQMTADVTTGDIAAGDFNGDGIADVASNWDNGLWWQDGTTSVLGTPPVWDQLDPVPAYSLTAGDITGDGRVELIGTWDQGIWYYDFVAEEWTQMTADVTTGDIAAGDFNGDGIADVASNWDNGLWWQDGTTSVLGTPPVWDQLDPVPAYSLTAGDITGDGRVELIGTWDNGIWYYDFVAEEWTQMTADVTTGDIAAGDFNGDGIADVASNWDNGLWWQDGTTSVLGTPEVWELLDPVPAYSLTAGDVTGQ